MLVRFSRRAHSPQGDQAMEVKLVVVGGDLAGKAIPIRVA